MSTTGPMAGTLEERLLRAERRLRQLGALIVFLILGFVVLLAWQFAPKSPIVQAGGFELRDQHWQRRAALILREDGSPALRINNPDGRARVMLNVANDGAVILRLSDERGFNRAYLALEKDGVPRLTLAGPDGRTRVALEVPDHGAPRITVRDSAQKTLWTTP